MNSLRFMRQFLRHPRQLGTAVQSGRTLARKMAEEIGESVHVIEFGAGTGPVTREILKCLPAHGRLTCFEINRELCRCLDKIGDPRLRVVHDDAAHCTKYVNQADCVVSGLPLTLFPIEAREKILSIACKSGRFIQLQYTPAVSKDIQRYFSDVKLKFVPMNFPPAFVFVCKSPCAVRVPTAILTGRNNGDDACGD